MRENPEVRYETATSTNAVTGEAVEIKLKYKKCVRPDGSTAEPKEFIEMIREASINIDPEAAEVMEMAVQAMDPYSVFEVPDEWYCVGNEYFARSPGGAWVWFGDLPEATAMSLCANDRRNLRAAQWRFGLSRLNGQIVEALADPGVRSRFADLEHNPLGLNRNWEVGDSQIRLDRRVSCD